MMTLDSFLAVLDDDALGRFRSEDGDDLGHRLNRLTKRQLVDACLALDIHDVNMLKDELIARLVGLIEADPWPADPPLPGEAHRLPDGRAIAGAPPGERFPFTYHRPGCTGEAGSYDEARKALKD